MASSKNSPALTLTDLCFCPAPVRRGQQRADLRAHHRAAVPGSALQPDYHPESARAHESKRSNDEDVLLQRDRADCVLRGHSPLLVHGLRSPVRGGGHSAALQGTL